MNYIDAQMSPDAMAIRFVLPEGAWDPSVVDGYWLSRIVTSHQDREAWEFASLVNPDLYAFLFGLLESLPGDGDRLRTYADGLEVELWSLPDWYGSFRGIVEHICKWITARYPDMELEVRLAASSGREDWAQHLLQTLLEP